MIDRYLDPLDNSSLTALCDCYVSLHRAEGFGFGPAEAMWLGKPVIATGYSGNLDFMTAENSLLVDYRLVRIGPGAGPYPADARWADPDVEHAGDVDARACSTTPSGPADWVPTAAADIRRTHSPTAVGAIMRRRLEAIRATGRPRQAIDPARRRPALAALRPRIGEGPVANARPGRAQALRELARNTVLRLMRPYTAYQQTIDTMVVDALDELDDRIAAQRTERAAERATLISELRGYEQLAAVIQRQARTIEALERRLHALERDESGIVTRRWAGIRARVSGGQEAGGRVPPVSAAGDASTSRADGRSLIRQPERWPRLPVSVPLSNTASCLTSAAGAAGSPASSSSSPPGRSGIWGLTCTRA